MLLVIVEILFFAHSTIVFGVVGIFLILASLFWAMIDRYPGETFFPTGRALAIPLLNLFLALIGAAIVIASGLFLLWHETRRVIEPAETV